MLNSATISPVLVDSIPLLVIFNETKDMLDFSMLRLFVNSAITLCLMMLTHTAVGQLREFDITPVQSNRIPVFRDHPDMAAVIIQSSMTNLQFDSNLGIVAILGNAPQGEYILIVRPVRQIMTVRASGFQQGRITVAPNAPRQVLYYSVEPKDRVITDRGNLIVRTEPSGALVSIDGIPGEYTTPYMFENLIAVTHSLRIRLDGYRTEERLVRTENGRTVVEELRMVPTVGFVTLKVPLAELFVGIVGAGEFNRVVLEPNRPIRLDPGLYGYRLERPFYRPFEGTLQIEAGGQYELDPILTPNFSTLRVRANAPIIQLSSNDNRAPESEIQGTIYLEPGQREVRVDAEGFAQARIQVRSVAGATLDTSVVLLTREQADDISRRQAMPRGVLRLAADVDAEILLDGRLQGRTEATLTLVPGLYEVEFRHPLKSERMLVNVPSADIVSRSVQFRPSKSRAVVRSMFIPGGGHIYTRRARGYLYMTTVVGSVGFAGYQYYNAGQKSVEFDKAMDDYRKARTLSEASLYRDRVLKVQTDWDLANAHMDIGLIVAAGVYVFQLMDIAVTRPKYGYRSTKSTVDLAMVPSGIRLSYRLP
jgi:hypothetical protein